MMKGRGDVETIDVGERRPSHDRGMVVLKTLSRRYGNIAYRLAGKVSGWEMRRESAAPREQRAPRRRAGTAERRAGES